MKHNNQFIYVNVGCQGRISDGGVFKNSNLYQGIISTKLNIPKPRHLPKTGYPNWEEDDNPVIPFVIVGVSENAFGILGA